MRKILLLFILLVGVSMQVNASQTNGDIKLSAPKTQGGAPILDTIKNRRSIRQISSKMLSDEHLSTLLWATWGISSEDGKRVVPTARNTQQMELYVAMKDGFYLYDAKENILIKKGSKDLREAVLGTQDFAKTTPVHLIIVSYDEKYGEFHAGSMYENASLYCASENLACVVRALFDGEKLSKELSLEGGKKAVMSIAVGYKN